jgi:hypothetical protein
VVYEERIIPQKTYVKKKIKQHGYCKICHEKVITTSKAGGLISPKRALLLASLKGISLSSLF